MGAITSQWIVDRLIVSPKTEFESGMNSAYISILKEIAPKQIPTQESINETKLKNVLGHTEFNKLQQSQIDELLSYHSKGEKLGFVKLIKELLGIGLVDGKNIADKLWLL